MRIFITGATGFIGRHLVLRLLRDGHSVRAWVRSVAKARSRLGAEVELVDASGGASALAVAVDGCDAVINLAGAPILGRWTEERKRRLVSSRVDLTRDLVAAIRGAERRPSVMLSASAVGYYGDRGSETLDERSAAGDDFLADLCVRWEDAAREVEALGVRLVRLRIGIVLGRDGGALEAMVKPARFGLGGPMGSGEQYIPWIHVDDLVELAVTAIGDPRYAGPLNGVGPDPATNEALAATIGRVLGRPSFLRVPAFALKLGLGEAATALLGGQRALPGVAAENGFQFRFTTLEAALRDLLRDDDAASIERADDGVPSSDYLRRRKPTYCLRQTVAIDAPLAEVFDFFRRAENLGVMTPSSMVFDIKTPTPIAVEEGTTIDYTIRLGPVPMGWKTNIERWEPGASFVDVQVRGPYRAYGTSTASRRRASAR
ncbi:MAG: TIGR01777 family oxidoreductase [Nannocystaceae bacterium]